jgi:anaerobic magnesium-protoporphyrin IX monomethyl ester cyclase
MKMVFIQPRSEEDIFYAPEPPLGLACLAASLLKYNSDLEIEIIDGFLLDYNDYLREISEIDADIVGVTSTLLQLGGATKIPSLVNDANAKFILGGPGVANISSSKLYDNGYSVLCHGEGERTIVEFVEALEGKLSLKDVDGISFLSHGREIRTPPRKLIDNLDDIPLPARELLDMEKYIYNWSKILGVRTTQMISSRGCQFSCRFCDRTVFGRKIRFMSSGRVIEEMKQLYDKYKVKSIYFEDDLFTLNKRRVLDFCATMKEELPGKNWGANARVETVDFEMLSQMKQAGCTELNFGIESGSQRILDFLGKGIKVDQIKKTFRWVNELEINGGMYLIIGIPGEKQSDIDMTKKLILELEPKIITLSFLTPIPGTEVFEMTKHLIRQDADFYNFNDAYESAYKKDAFEVEPIERYREVMNYFLETFKGKIDPNFSITGDGSIIYGNSEST